MSITSRPRVSIVVVEDEPTIAEIVARYLERAGYDARVAGDGPGAVAALPSSGRIWSCWT